MDIQRCHYYHDIKAAPGTCLLANALLSYLSYWRLLCYCSIVILNLVLIYGRFHNLLSLTNSETRCSTINLHSLTPSQAHISTLNSGNGKVRPWVNVSEIVCLYMCTCVFIIVFAALEWSVHLSQMNY